MTTKIEVNELPTGVISVEIPFQIRDKKIGENRYDWSASLPPVGDESDESFFTEESDRYFKTAAEALDDLFKTFGVERGA